MVPLLNDPIMSGRSIQLFRHLESQNMCISKSYGRIVSQAEKQRQLFCAPHGQSKIPGKIDGSRNSYETEKPPVTAKKYSSLKCSKLSKPN